MMNKNMQQYQTNQINTASPERILLMLYDGAIRFTRQAIEGVENNDASLRRYGVSKAIAIITEFSNSLDHNIGGQIAEDLDALYDFMIREMTAANLKNESDKLRAVEKLLVDLRQTWGEAVDISKKEAAGKPQAEQLQAEQPAAAPVQNTKVSGYGAKTDEAANYTPLSVSG